MPCNGPKAFAAAILAGGHCKPEFFENVARLFSKPQIRTRNAVQTRPSRDSTLAHGYLVYNLCVIIFMQIHSMHVLTSYALLTATPLMPRFIQNHRPMQNPLHKR